GQLMDHCSKSCFFCFSHSLCYPLIFIFHPNLTFKSTSASPASCPVISDPSDELDPEEQQDKRVTDEFWLNQTPISECETPKTEHEATEMENSEMSQSSSSPLDDKHLRELRWARLFGSKVGTPVGPQNEQKSGPLRNRMVEAWCIQSGSACTLSVDREMARESSEW
ncbi:hypothetical protein M9458_021632, partial [Cirrhinus mrigala]